MKATHDKFCSICLETYRPVDERSRFCSSECVVIFRRSTPARLTKTCRYCLVVVSSYKKAICGSVTCEKKRNTEKMRTYRWKLRASGIVKLYGKAKQKQQQVRLCRTCGYLIGKQRNYCDACLRKRNNDRARAHYIKWKSIRISTFSRLTQGDMGSRSPEHGNLDQLSSLSVWCREIGKEKVDK